MHRLSLLLGPGLLLRREIFYRMLCTANVCAQKITLQRLGGFGSSSCIADSTLTILEGRKSSP
jgi:hypothetical protein